MDKIRKIIQEELESAYKKIFSRINRIFEDGNQNSAHRSLKLQFKSRVSQTILTGEEIKAEGDSFIEVVLLDSAGNIVEVGPEAFANVEIVLLKGNFDEGDDDWTFEKFNENIVGEIHGKKLLAGKERLKLEKGIVCLKNIKFRHHASKVRPSVFRLGARVVDAFDGVQIKEAKTECFNVKDFRNKYYIKHEIPSLPDAVPRLSNIRKGGKIDKRLQNNKIYTVEDFLIRLLIDPEGLKNIVNLGAAKWEVTVNNARRCLSDTRMYCYVNSEQKMCVVFNVLGSVLGLYLNKKYTPTTMLSENYKADAQELLSSAYKNWDNVKSFDDENALRKYLSGLSTITDPHDSLNPDHYRIYNMDIVDDDLLQHNPQSSLDPKKLSSDFDDFFRLKMWKKMFCVSRVFSIRKKLSIGGHHKQKKQKTH